MSLKSNGLLQGITVTLMWVSVMAPAQQQSAPEPTPTPTPTADTQKWNIGPIHFSGFLDSYGSYNANHPSNPANGQTNDLYNFNDKTNQVDLSSASLSMNHDPQPVGIHADLILGRTNTLIRASSKDSANYLEQAFISFKPTAWHGTQFDVGQFVTSAGAETIAAKDNWNYSRSILFVSAIPYYHFGLRTSFPAIKDWSAGVQIVNGWNSMYGNNGGATIGLTGAYTKPKYTWSLNDYTGPQSIGTQKAYCNLIDTTFLLTPTARFNAYINYDYGQNRTSQQASGEEIIPSSSAHWQGIALAARVQITGKSATAVRYEHFYDGQGVRTGTAQTLNEFTGTYEYRWMKDLVTRAEYRHDWSNADFFHKGNTNLVKAQSTASLAFIAYFGAN